MISPKTASDGLMHQAQGFDLKQSRRFDDHSYCWSRRKRSGKRWPGQSDKGQIVVEYVLLLVVAVSLAVIITRTMISQDQGEPGFIIQTWSEVLNQIGADEADDIEAPQN